MHGRRLGHMDTVAAVPSIPQRCLSLGAAHGAAWAGNRLPQIFLRSMLCNWMVSKARRLTQLVQQRLCFLQIGRVKALGEPAIDRGEEIAGFGTAALIAAKPSEA